MNVDDEVLSLQKCEMFRDVGPAPLKLLTMVADRIVFAPGEKIYGAGETADSVYIVLAGAFRLAIRTEEGLVDSGIALQSALLGEIGVILDMPHQSDLRAATEVTALRIDREHFLRLLQECQPFNRAVMRELCRQIRELNRLWAGRAEKPAGVPALRDVSRLPA